ncbi:uncharacterized protein EV420DRAFT_642986 [Desarmillaria tabescens]|uniref:Extracellular membrane protein CFEM domain-containing protein n=1 Tax=Armillaria tabescens TaxID=1929756 RepID=A0AA39NJB7_ARMTA|nr:uncharacterized protein EV420DRAFT_642986 [Desarmillaria tabescens]KAK0466711.1 hypothetical protein EV420DRAFT_642986 [Desarmillaria tabescens]
MFATGSRSLLCAFSVLLMVHGGLSSIVPPIRRALQLPLDGEDSSELTICQDQCTIVDTLGACTLSDVNCLCSNDSGKAYAKCLICLVGASQKDIKEPAQTAADLYVISCMLMGVSVEKQTVG